MDIETARKILQTRGSQPDNWPEKDRERIWQLIKSDKSLQQLLTREQRLDELLETGRSYTDSVSSSQIAQKLADIILTQHQNPLDRIMEWVQPSGLAYSTGFLKPALAASILLMSGVITGILSNEIESSHYTEADLMWEEDAILLIDRSLTIQIGYDLTQDSQ